MSWLLDEYGLPRLWVWLLDAVFIALFVTSLVYLATRRGK